MRNIVCFNTLVCNVLDLWVYSINHLIFILDLKVEGSFIAKQKKGWQQNKDKATKKKAKAVSEESSSNSEDYLLRLAVEEELRREFESKLKESEKEIERKYELKLHEVHRASELKLDEVRCEYELKLEEAEKEAHRALEAHLALELKLDEAEMEAHRASEAHLALELKLDEAGKETHRALEAQRALELKLDEVRCEHQLKIDEAAKEAFEIGYKEGMAAEHDKLYATEDETDGELLDSLVEENKREEGKVEPSIQVTSPSSSPVRKALGEISINIVQAPRPLTSEKKPRKCGICKHEGHNAARCPEKVDKDEIESVISSA